MEIRGPPCPLGAPPILLWWRGCARRARSSLGAFGMVGVRTLAAGGRETTHVWRRRGVSRLIARLEAVGEVIGYSPKPNELGIPPRDCSDLAQDGSQGASSPCTSFGVFTFVFGACVVGFVLRSD